MMWCWESRGGGVGRRICDPSFRTHGTHIGTMQELYCTLHAPPHFQSICIQPHIHLPQDCVDPSACGQGNRSSNGGTSRCGCLQDALHRLLQQRDIVCLELDANLCWSNMCIWSNMPLCLHPGGRHMLNDCTSPMNDHNTKGRHA